MYKKKLFLVLALIFLIILSGFIGFFYGQAYHKKNVTIKDDISNQIQNIKIEIISQQRMPSVGTAYSIKLTNGSSYTIKQNSVFLSYPIKTGQNNSTMNKCKVEAIGNKLDILPNESVILNVFIPKEYYENNIQIDSDNPDYEIQGYINEVKEINHFGRSGGFINNIGL